jgi:hypothetical protein
MNTSRITRWSVLAVALSLTAACGGGGGDSGDQAAAQPNIVIEGDAPAGTTGSTAGSSGSTATTTGGSVAAAATGTDEERALALAQCMRDEGIDFPDPTIGADGSVTFGDGTGAGAGAPNLGSQEFADALEVCQPLVEGASFLPQQDDLTGIEDSLLEVAQCLRDQGIDVDDPDLSGGIPTPGQGGTGGPGGAGGPFGPNFDPEDPKTAAALEECGDVFANLPVPGGGN